MTPQELQADIDKLRLAGVPANAMVFIVNDVELGGVWWDTQPTTIKALLKASKQANIVVHVLDARARIQLKGLHGADADEIFHHYSSRSKPRQ